jgi:hypothetical protein
LVRQNGDSEGVLSFDPNDREQAKLAIKMAGARAKRNTSTAQMRNLEKGVRFHRMPYQSEQNTTIETTSAV